MASVSRLPSTRKGATPLSLAAFEGHLETVPGLGVRSLLQNVYVL